MDLTGRSPAEVASVVRTLAERLARGLVIVGLVDDAGHADLVAALRGLPGLEVERVLDAERQAERLRWLNRSRDVLRAGGTTVLLTAPDEARLRGLLASTPDLTSTPDATFEIRKRRTAGDPRSLAASLRTFAVERSAIVDLSGLLPGDVAASRVPVDRLYMDLVDPRAAARTEAEARPIPRLLVLGQPGAGKSTFLRMLAHEYATEVADRLGVGTRVPLFVPLPAYARALEERRASLAFGEFLVDWLDTQGVQDSPALPALGANLLVLCDGLDEVRGAIERRRVLNEVRRFAAEGPAVVVAARSLVLDDLTADQVDVFVTCHVKPPDSDARAAYLARFFAERGVREPEREAREVAQRIDADLELQELARTPLLLVFLALIHELEGRIPDRRFLLYSKVADILLDRWERARARARGTRTPARAVALGDTRRVIGALAWWMLETGRAEVRGPELQAELARIERERGASEAEAEARARGLAEILQTSSAVLATTGDGRWRFVHATLAEYFAGVDVARGGARWRQVLDAVFRVDWQEVVTFAAGELGVRADDARLDELAAALLRRHRLGGRYGAADASTLGAVLREDPGFAPATARRLVERFVELCFVPRYWPRSRPAVAAAFRAMAKVAAHRTWGDPFQSAIASRAGTEWREDMSELAAALAECAPELDGAGTFLEHLCASTNPTLVEAGWRGRYVLAVPERREEVVSAALAAGVEHRFLLTMGEEDMDDYIGHLMARLSEVEHTAD